MAESFYSRAMVCNAFSRLQVGLALLAALGGALAAQAQTTAIGCTKGQSFVFFAAQNAATNAYELDIASGTLTQRTTNGILSTSPYVLNAFGYNQADGLLYAQRNATYQLVRIDKNYVTTVLDVSGMSGNNDDIQNAVVGDVDANGIMYLTRGGSVGGGNTLNGTTGNTVFNIYAINLKQSPLTATLLPVKPALTFINDWAISPQDGNLYAIYSQVQGTAAKLTLYRYTTTGAAAGTRTDLGEVTAGSPVVSGTDHPIAAANYGSCYMDKAGDFYVIANGSGYTYRIQAPHKLAAGGSPVANYVSATSSQLSNFIDAARCPTTQVATSGPLPVQLTDFTAAAAPNRAVRLAWTTASELNNAYFEVQRSADGQLYSALGKVPGHGTTVQANTYAYTDAAPGNAGTYYYRLQQVDADGSVDFSPVRAVALAAGSSPVQLTVAPNPTSAADLRVLVQYAGLAPAEATLTLHSLLGQPVRTQAVTLQPGANTLHFDAPGAPGAYWLTVSGAGRPGVKVLLTE